MTTELESEYVAIRASLDDVGVRQMLDSLRDDYSRSNPARFAEHLKIAALGHETLSGKPAARLRPTRRHLNLGMRRV